MVQGSGKESAPSLGIRIESGKLVINRTSDYFIETHMKIALKSTRVTQMKNLIQIYL